MNVQYIETAILKQTAINRLPLPDLVLAQIKDYLFYDPQISKQIQATRNNKSKILNKIEDSYTREKHKLAMVNDYNKYYKDDFDSLENYIRYKDWHPSVFHFHFNYNYNAKYGNTYFSMSTRFCTSCGNYTSARLIFNDSPIHDKCLCVCKVQK